MINSLHQARLWLEAGGGPCDLMVDTGINRLGLPPARARRSARSPRCEIDTLMSHLASADEDAAQNERQLRAVRRRSRAHVPARRRSLANSAGIALGRGLCLRPHPARAWRSTAASRAPSWPTRSARSPIPQAAVLQLRELSPGDSVGYNATFTADRPMRAATVSLGYADGFLRCWSGKGALRFGEAAAAGARPRVDGHGGGRCHRRARPARRRLARRALRPARSRGSSGLSQYELLTLLGRRFARSN